jgi:dUTPase
MSEYSAKENLSNLSKLLNKCDKVMYLKIFVEGSYNLKKMYHAAVDNHNSNLLKNQFLDAGFDLFLPENENPNELEKWDDNIPFFGTGWNKRSPVNKVDFKIKCSAQMYCDTGKNFSTGYYMYPRSSLSKTKLRLANCVGIIDSGYRGNLIGMFDVVNVEENNKNNRDPHSDADYFAKVNDRLIQICAPGLIPIYVEVVDFIEDLGNETERGSGGFGSTGS